MVREHPGHMALIGESPEDLRRHLYARYPVHHELGRNDRLRLADIRFPTMVSSRKVGEGAYELRTWNCDQPEEELSVEIGDVNRVHVDNMNVAESHCIVIPC
jgi:hypothetical protein